MIRFYFILILLFGFHGLQAQQTINPNDLSGILLGGAQESAALNVQLQPVALVDLEPDQIQFVNLGGVGTILEAGLAPDAGGGNANENTEFWVNLTCRKDLAQTAELVVQANQKLPNKMKLFVEVIQVNISGTMSGSPVTGPIEIKTGAAVLINSISLGFTGDGQGIGYQLKYTLSNPQNDSFPPGYEVFFTLNLN